MHQDKPLLQRLHFVDEVQNVAQIDQGAAQKIRDQERTLAERLISEHSATEFHPENCEDDHQKRLWKAIEQKIAGQEIQRLEVEARPPTPDLVATLEASLGRRHWRRRDARKPRRRFQRPSASSVAARPSSDGRDDSFLTYPRAVIPPVGGPQC